MVVIAPLWQTNPVRYLLNDKYPLHLTLSLSGSTSPRSDADEATFQKVAHFRKLLEAKPRDEPIGEGERACLNDN